MGNYFQTGPFINGVIPPGISAAFLNAVENVLEQPSGGTETGKYWLYGGGYAANAHISQYMSSLSRTSVPVSVVIDTADFVASNFMNAPTTGQLTANGFQVDATVSATTTNAKVAGNTTITW